jgi:hypothetical protein
MLEHSNSADRFLTAPLQRGVKQAERNRSRFNGFSVRANPVWFDIASCPSWKNAP